MESVSQDVTSGRIASRDAADVRQVKWLQGEPLQYLPPVVELGKEQSRNKRGSEVTGSDVHCVVEYVDEYEGELR